MENQNEKWSGSMPDLKKCVEDVLNQYRPAMEADGVGLEISNIEKELIQLKISFEETSCMDCVLPKGTLEMMLEKSIEKVTAMKVQVELDDPREK